VLIVRLGIPLAVLTNAAVSVIPEFAVEDRDDNPIPLSRMDRPAAVAGPILTGDRRPGA
jgi:hypothetical protein